MATKLFKKYIRKSLRLPSYLFVWKLQELVMTSWLLLTVSWLRWLKLQEMKWRLQVFEAYRRYTDKCWSGILGQSSYTKGGTTCWPVLYNAFGDPTDGDWKLKREEVEIGGRPSTRFVVSNCLNWLQNRNSRYWLEYTLVSWSETLRFRPLTNPTVIANVALQNRNR